MLLLPLAFMAARCGDMVLFGGFAVYWLPLALFASASTLFILALVRVDLD